jgi:hypothetical protein
LSRKVAQEVPVLLLLLHEEPCLTTAFGLFPLDLQLAFSPLLPPALSGFMGCSCRGNRFRTGSLSFRGTLLSPACIFHGLSFCDSSSFRGTLFSPACIFRGTLLSEVLGSAKYSVPAWCTGGSVVTAADVIGKQLLIQRGLLSKLLFTERCQRTTRFIRESNVASCASFSGARSNARPRKMALFSGLFSGLFSSSSADSAMGLSHTF